MSLENIFRLSVIVNMIDRISGPTAQIGEGIDENIGRLDQWGNKIREVTKYGTGFVSSGLAITSGMMALGKTTFGTSKALGELSSLGIEDLGALENAAKDFSNQWAGTTKADFVTAAYDIKSGIASLTDEGVAQYTELAGLTAKATKASTAEMTSLFATGYGIYKDYYSDLSDMDFGEVFGAGIAKSVQQFKTAGSEMASAISSLGAQATSAGVPLEEQLSVLGMLQATMSGSEAGTKYSAFLRSAAKAGESLGLSFLDSNNQMLALPDILDQLRSKYGDTIDAVEKQELTKAFGTDEAVAMIDLLYNKTDDLQGNILTLYDSMGQGRGAVEQMADAINNTDPDQFEVFSQNVQNLKEDLGSLLLPALNQILCVGQKVVSGVSNFVEKHQKLTQFILVFVMTLGTALTATGAFLLTIRGCSTVIIALIKAVTGIGGAFKVLKSGFDTARIVAMYGGDALKLFGGHVMTLARSFGTAMMSMASAAWSFLAPILANPITWVIIAIVAAIALLWRNWDTVTAFCSKAWATLTGKVSAGVAAIKGVFTGMINFVKEKLAWFKEAGGKIITTLVSGIKSMASKPVEAVKGIFSKVRKLLPFSDAKEGPLSELTLSGRRVMTTMSAGMQMEANAPEREAEKAFTGLSRKTEIKKVNWNRRSDNAGSESLDGVADGTGKKTYIKNLILKVDLTDIEDLKKIKDLIASMEDYQNSNEDTDMDLDEFEFA